MSSSCSSADRCRDTEYKRAVRRSIYVVATGVISTAKVRRFSGYDARMTNFPVFLKSKAAGRGRMTAVWIGVGPRAAAAAPDR